MPVWCLVVGCGSDSSRDQISFHNVPRILKFKHKPQLNELSKKRREKWITALKREDLTESKLHYGKICGKYFLSDKI